MQATIPAGLDRKEAEVYQRLDPERLPKHIAIIMDGNGRWAKRRHLPRMAGHRAGVTSVRSTVETAARIGIPWLTLYAFSEENWKKRPRGEVDFLMGLLCRYLKRKFPPSTKTISGWNTLDAARASGFSAGKNGMGARCDRWQHRHGADPGA